MFLLVCVLIVMARSDVNIPFRQFSLSPSLSGVGSTDPNNNNYGAAQYFIDYVRTYTSALGAGMTVNFVPEGVSFAATDNCSVIQQVGQVPGCALNTSNVATLDAGYRLNPLWGFMFSNGPWFGPNFEDFFEFMSSPTGAGTQSGLQLLQSILDKNNANVQIIPAVGAPRQSSGFLQEDAGIVGLAEICKRNWTWRFIPPNQQVLDRACSNLVGAAKRINFVTSILGFSPVSLVQQRIVNAFEFSDAIDTFDAAKGGFFPLGNPPSQVLCSAANPFPACTQNPGEIGLRYMHYPGWHEDRHAGWMFLNKQVWTNQLNAAQRQRVIEAGFNAMKDSWKATSSVECEYIQRMLDINNGRVQRNADGSVKDCEPATPGVQNCSADMQLAQWNCRDLRALRNASVQYINSLTGGNSTDQQDLNTILDAYTAFTQDIGFVWRRESFPRGCSNAGRNLRKVCDCCDDCNECDEIEDHHNDDDLPCHKRPGGCGHGDRPTVAPTVAPSVSSSPAPTKRRW